VAKRFEAGSQVEVRRHPGSPWEAAQYEKRIERPSGLVGYHWVQLPQGKERWLNEEGIEVEPFTEGAQSTRALLVPARRIRKVTAR
jgi:hypothetical protein